ncbi:DUF4198 domain-containing protein [Azoarcus olearius]|uniref:Cobalt transport system, periplasmic-binding protein n=1 Tax=Azoarcus sp. (strain BH72) TaxID=418699 RepID=A1K7N0_AZOSB|nr:DUF4198 domain-containing protein [Azoarcus olearius]CAL94835.1 putative cobalt transport system, periplasmic-binding protein [Azoarcus olearius]
MPSPSSPVRRSGLAALAALLCAALAGPAAAHTVWLEADSARAGDYLVRFGGHADKLESYPAEKLGAVHAYDAAGAPLAVQREDGAEGVRVRAAGAPVLLTASYDNGYWSKTANGKSINKPMNEVAGVRSAVHAIKFHKTIVQWGEQATRALGQPFELRPLAATPARAGQPLQLEVLIDGKPAPGIRVAFGEEGADAVSDDKGIATLTPRAGLNRLWAGRRQAVSNDPRLTELSIEYSLVFSAR